MTEARRTLRRRTGRGSAIPALVALLAVVMVGLVAGLDPLAQRGVFEPISDEEVIQPAPRRSSALQGLPEPSADDVAVKNAVELGLAHIASLQQDDGSWINDIGFKLGAGMGAYKVTPMGDDQPHVGVTALCCMAFMANGHTVDRGEYQGNVRRGLRFILANMDSFGQVKANGSRMYSHAFATLFLCEVYGMTGDMRTKEALTNAVSFIMKNQVSAETNFGGWRYEPGQQDADTSITVCQVQALRAARNVGIVVPQAIIDAARRYIVGNYRAEVGSFAYQPEQGYGRTSMALTAAGVVSLQSAGQYDSYRDPSGALIDLQAALRFITQYRPDERLNMDARVVCDFGFWYGHYYAAQAFRQYGHVRPDYWVTWNQMNRRHFLKMQKSGVNAKGQRVGYWIDEVGNWDKDRAYATAMACLILSIPNDYLPIFQN